MWRSGGANEVDLGLWGDTGELGYARGIMPTRSMAALRAQLGSDEVQTTEWPLPWLKRLG
jgi:hypothetical protein